MSIARYSVLPFQRRPSVAARMAKRRLSLAILVIAICFSLIDGASSRCLGQSVPTTSILWRQGGEKPGLYIQHTWDVIDPANLPALPSQEPVEGLIQTLDIQPLIQWRAVSVVNKPGNTPASITNVRDNLSQRLLGKLADFTFGSPNTTIRGTLHGISADRITVLDASNQATRLIELSQLQQVLLVPDTASLPPYSIHFSGTGAVPTFLTVGYPLSQDDATLRYSLQKTTGDDPILHADVFLTNGSLVDWDADTELVIRSGAVPPVHDDISIQIGDLLRHQSVRVGKAIDSISLKRAPMIRFGLDTDSTAVGSLVFDGTFRYPTGPVALPLDDARSLLVNALTDDKPTLLPIQDESIIASAKHGKPATERHIQSIDGTSVQYCNWIRQSIVVDAPKPGSVRRIGFLPAQPIEAQVQLSVRGAATPYFTVSFSAQEAGPQWVTLDPSQQSEIKILVVNPNPVKVDLVAIDAAERGRFANAIVDPAMQSDWNRLLSAVSDLLATKNENQAQQAEKEAVRLQGFLATGILSDRIPTTADEKREKLVRTLVGLSVSQRPKPTIKCGLPVLSSP